MSKTLCELEEEDRLKREHKKGLSIILFIILFVIKYLIALTR